MLKAKSNSKKFKFLSKQIMNLTVDQLGLPRFSLPFIGPRYLSKKRRIMVVYYQARINRELLKSEEKFVYDNNADNLFKETGPIRVSPYAIEDSDFNLSYLIENIGTGMTYDDLVIHRFIPYPQIKGLVDSFDKDIYKKAVNFFVGVVNLCQPTHVFFIFPHTSYLVDEIFTDYRKQSLYDFLSDRYITPVYGSESFAWESFVPMDVDDGVIRGCAGDLLSDIDFAKGALNDPRLKSAMYWDDEKIMYYGSKKQRLLQQHYKENPAKVKESLLDKDLPDSIRSILIRPFENLRFDQILYTLLDRYPCEMYGEVEKLEEIQEWVTLYNENLKAYGSAFKKPLDIYGSPKIRSLSINLQYALFDLAKKLRLEYDSKKLDGLRRNIEALYQETEKMYAVRKPIKMTTVTKMQSLARSKNLENWKSENTRKKNTEVKPVGYKRKVISEKQLRHLEKIRKLRWPKSNKS